MLISGKHRKKRTQRGGRFFRLNADFSPLGPRTHLRLVRRLRWPVSCISADVSTIRVGADPPGQHGIQMCNLSFSINMFYLLLCVMPALAVAVGAIVANLIRWNWLSKFDLPVGRSETMGGLARITAGINCISRWWSMVTGAYAGAFVVTGVRLLRRLRMDDPFIPDVSWKPASQRSWQDCLSF